MPRRVMVSLLALLMLALGGCARAPYNLEAQQQTTQVSDVAWERERGQWVLTVPTEPGIGALTITPQAQAVMSRPVLVLHLPLKGLEQVKVSYADRVLTAGIGDQGEIQQAECRSCTEQEADKLKLLLLPRNDGNGYNIYLPHDYWQNSRGPISVSWVDFFR